MKVAAVISLPLALAVAMGAITPASSSMIVPDRKLPTTQIEGPFPAAYHHGRHWAVRGYERHLPRHAYIPYARSGSRPYAYAATTAYYYIVNQSTGMVAEVMNRSMDDKAQVVLWHDYHREFDNKSEQWSVVPLRDGVFPGPPEDAWFLLQNRNSGLCLHTKGYKDDARVVQHTCDADATQMWRLRKRGSRVVLENMAAINDNQERCLDAANGQAPTPPREGAALQAHPCIPNGSVAIAVNQDWVMVDINDYQP